MPVSPLRPTDPAQIGGYPVAARLGSGGMGVVYLATDPAGRPLAIKQIATRLAADPDFRLRFRREVRAARAVGGTCAVRVVAADPDAERPWLATEYVAGSSLTEVVEAEGALVGDVLDSLAVGLAEALYAMHGVGVVHRDLKPSNVILTADGPRVIDFGVSWYAESTPLTGPGSLLGSPGYMAPEQVAAGETGPYTDVYSWALTLAFAATGRPPYGLGRPEVLLYRVIGERPDLTGVPDRLLPVLQAALRPDPGSRPSTTDLLHQLLPGEAADPAEATQRLLDERWQLPGLPRTVTDLGSLPVVAPSTSAVAPVSAPAAASPAPAAPSRATAPGRGAAPAAPGHGGASTSTSAGKPGATQRRRPGWLSGPWIPAAVAIAGALTIAIVATLLTRGGSVKSTGLAPAGTGGALTGSTPIPVSTAPLPTSTAFPVPVPSAPSTAGGATPVAPNPAATPPIALPGLWRGGYVCSQGPTGLLLSIVLTPSQDLWARFDFYPLPSNPGVPRGSYLMRIIYADGVLNFTGVRWIEQPPGYNMANLTARPLAGTPDELTGRVRLNGCTTFAVHRQ
ncbi:serine/threonine-protein kinase [Frankia sp. R82]|uniref:protein kinase domain-containing protein n=1 Tax=Frankia sp. R82 TaxID=2950553 RepID=UPI002043381B|nr:serine/threonine-protein kinase [Frankia sp. R82]MCM3882074.1 serine/threonine protein kinase [Frankia sp. R82]